MRTKPFLQEARNVKFLGDFTYFGKPHPSPKRRCRQCDAFLSQANPGYECFAHSYVEDINHIEILKLMGAEE